MSNNKSSHASERQLAASLLKEDKVLHRFFAKTSRTVTYARYALQRNMREGTIATVQVTENAVMPVKHIHAGDFTPESTEFVVVKVNILTYGEGEIIHPYFLNRNKFTDANTELYLAVRELEPSKVYVLRKTEGVTNSFTRIGQEAVEDLFAPFGKASEIMGAIIAKLAAANNEINNGGIKQYDARLSVEKGKLTPYGQFLKDSGKPDKAMKAEPNAKAFRERVVTPA